MFVNPYSPVGPAEDDCIDFPLQYIDDLFRALCMWTHHIRPYVLITINTPPLCRLITGPEATPPYLRPHSSNHLILGVAFESAAGVCITQPFVGKCQALPQL